MCKIILGILLLKNIRLIYKNYSKLKTFKVYKKDIYDSELEFGILISPFFMFFVYFSIVILLIRCLMRLLIFFFNIPRSHQLLASGNYHAKITNKNYRTIVSCSYNFNKITYFKNYTDFPKLLPLSNQQNFLITIIFKHLLK